ncbi:MAG TPA: nucleotidyltransferase family protein [Propionibacteriaceae bacterium]|nr:nucleotidyltransferase family protein [Propionibacteriaceae bacterium]
MKAFLLAAGLGTRLRPITDSTPKCLLRIGGVPLLDIWLDALAGSGVDEVLVNTHHLAYLVSAHVAARTGPPVVHLVEEPELLGSAGTLRANRDFVAGETMFLAVNADNLTDFDLRVLINAHQSASTVATLSLFHAPQPSACGIVDVDNGVVVGYVEKPANPSSDLANAGIYAFHPRVLDDITGPTPTDIGYDLLPQLVGRARAVRLDGSYFIDIGTPAALQQASEEWESRLVK